MKNFIKRNYPYLIAIVLLITLAFFSESKYRSFKNLKNNQRVLLLDSIKTLKLANGEYAKNVQNLIVSNRELKNQKYILDDSLNNIVKKYSKVSSATIIKTVTKIDTIKIFLKEDSDKKGIKYFTKKDPNYSFSGFINEQNLTLTDLKIPTTLRVVIGKEKINFFKRELTSSITSSNPLLDIENITTQVTSSRIKRFGIGPYVGYDISGNISAGIGLNYSLIKF